MSPRHVGAAVALALALAAGAILALRRGPAPDAPAAPTRADSSPRAPSGELPSDPMAYVPASARTVAWFDLAALRRAPALARWFDAEPSDGDCRAALARRARAVVLVVPRAPSDDFALVVAGDLRPGDFSRCVESAGDEVRRGVPLTVVRGRRGDAGASRALLAWTRAGVALVGPAELVDRMLDRALDVSRGDAAPLALDPLRRHLRAGATAWALTARGDDFPPGDALASVSGAALSAVVRDDVSLEASLLCDDSAHATRVAGALGTLRASLLAELTSPPLRALAEGALVEPAGAAVRVRATLGAGALEGLAADVVGALAGAGLGR